MKKYIASVLTLGLLMLGAPIAAIAVDEPAKQFVIPVTVPPAVQGPSVTTIIKNVTNTLAFVAGVAAVIAIIIGGILYITSAGDEGRVKSAKNTITFAIVGLVIAFLAYGLANFVLTTLTTGTPK